MHRVKIESTGIWIIRRYDSGQLETDSQACFKPIGSVPTHVSDKANSLQEKIAQILLQLIGQSDFFKVAALILSKTLNQQWFFFQ